jgi:hypothetical protein
MAQIQRVERYRPGMLCLGRLVDPDASDLA